MPPAAQQSRHGGRHSSVTTLRLPFDPLNKTFQTAVVATREGGSGGGGASLTPFGSKLVADYRTIERDAVRAASAEIAELDNALA